MTALNVDQLSGAAREGRPYMQTESFLAAGLVCCYTHKTPEPQLITCRNLSSD